MNRHLTRHLTRLDLKSRKNGKFEESGMVSEIPARSKRIASELFRCRILNEASLKAMEAEGNSEKLVKKLLNVSASLFIPAFRVA